MTRNLSLNRFAAAAMLAGTVVAGTASASAQSSFGPGIYWGHNGSWMSIMRSGQNLRILYDTPRSGMRKQGARRGTVLFRGRMTGNRIRGTAYTFKRGCQPASYNVSGRHFLNSGGYGTIVLTGAAPIRDGCEVVGYTRKSSNARLEFGWAGTGD
jgi:hypothetical protein